MHHKIRPFELSGPDRYSRLFPPAETVIAPTDSRLEDLAWSMCDSRTRMDPEEIELENRATRRIPAAYTYFGQFIDHDLTSEAFTPTESVSPEPRDIPNHRRRWLNLDCLYGEEPGMNPEIYKDDKVSFRLGDPVRPIDPGNPAKKLCFDVPLGENDSIPKVADLRNLENPLVRQVHAMFLMLHNAALKELPPSLPAPFRLRAARRRVCHQYQWLVRNDFLPMICDPVTYGSVLDEPLIDWDGRFSIPVEFARAAFRFGHSMVRNSYSLSGGSFSLEKLLEPQLTGALSPEKAIRWRFFAGPNSSEFAFRIDTRVAGALFHVPGHRARLFRSIAQEAQEEIVLPLITLRRGAGAHMPSGQQVRGILRTNPIEDASVWAAVASAKLEKATPLWYYILLEAQTLGEGRRLGPMGSRIVAETIEGALWGNPDSYVRFYGQHWVPEPWTVPEKRGKRSIFNLHDLAVVVGLDSSLR